jgi:3-oxoacyl-[acyl-carrier protein] reductase
MSSLKGKVALVTGASRGIGAGIAIELAREGADVVITYVSNPDGAQKTVNELKAFGTRVLAIQSDVADLKGHQDLVNKIVAEFGKIDILINNAGVFGTAPLGQITEADFDRVFSINTKAALFLIQAVVPHIPAGGSIVNISTGGTKAPLPAPYYVASKLALEGFTMTLARELGAKGIRINTVSPGYTDTDMMRAGGPELAKTGIEASALKRLGTTEDVARVVAWVVDPIKAGWIVGQNISATGGVVLLP